MSAEPRLVTPECAAPVALTDAEMAFLDELEHGAFHPQRNDTCALIAGHPGAHACSPQCEMAEDDRPIIGWWLLWGKGERRIESFTAECPYADPVWPQEACDLYPGHPGAHRELVPPGWLPPA